IEAYRVLPDIDAHYDDRRADLLGHGMLWSWRPFPASLAGGAGARPDHPISDIARSQLFTSFSVRAGDTLLASEAEPKPRRVSAPSWERSPPPGLWRARALEPLCNVGRRTARSQPLKKDLAKYRHRPWRLSKRPWRGPFKQALSDVQRAIGP